jgi:tripartite-type tricarboxylate transporter receptor subunit TctC
VKYRSFPLLLRKRTLGSGVVIERHKTVQQIVVQWIHRPVDNMRLPLMAKNRLSSAPDIPTVDEGGLTEFYGGNWTAFWVPRGTPKDVIAKLNEAVVAALANANVQARLADLGMEQTPEALGALQKSEIEKSWPIIKAGGIKVE